MDSIIRLAFVIKDRTSKLCRLMFMLVYELISESINFLSKRKGHILLIKILEGNLILNILNVFRFTMLSITVTYSFTRISLIASITMCVAWSFLGKYPFCHVSIAKSGPRLIFS